MNETLNLISSIGFPAVMCLLMFKEFREQDKMHREETDHLRDAIDNNTLAITRLLDKLGED